MIEHTTCRNPWVCNCGCAGCGAAYESARAEVGEAWRDKADQLGRSFLGLDHDEAERGGSDTSAPAAPPVDISSAQVPERAMRVMFHHDDHRLDVFDPSGELVLVREKLFGSVTDISVLAMDALCEEVKRLRAIIESRPLRTERSVVAQNDEEEP